MRTGGWISSAGTDMDVILECYHKGTFDGTGKVIRCVRLHEVSSCKGMGQILLSQGISP